MFRYDKLTSDQLQFYRDEGYLLLREAADASTARRCREEVLEIMQRIGLGESKLRQTTQYLAGSTLDTLINSAKLKSVAGDLLGGRACLFMPFTAVKSAGGGGTFHFHQDNQYTEFDGPGVNFWFALDEMSEANGCLWIAPRSHLQGTLPAIPSPDGDQHKTVKELPDDVIPILMRPGDCVAFSRLTVHGSGANLSDDHRVAYAVQFHRSDVRSRRPGEEWTLLRENPRWEVKPVLDVK